MSKLPFKKPISKSKEVFKKKSFFKIPLNKDCKKTFNENEKTKSQKNEPSDFDPPGQTCERCCNWFYLAEKNSDGKFICWSCRNF